MILWEFQNYGELRLAVILGPGELSVRNGLHQLIRQHPTVFNKATQTLYPKYWTFHSERWITRKQYEEADLDELRRLIKDRFDRLAADEVPAMQAVLGEAATT
jgi:hypothetical protein